MRKLTALACAALAMSIGPLVILLTITAGPVYASNDYTAKLRDDGKYCARVELEGPGSMRFHKTKCRTLEQWVSEGYSVKQTNGTEVEI